LIALKNVTDADDLMIINRSGIIIRMKVSDLRVVGRATQGVKLINLKNGDSIAAVTQVPTEENEEEDMENGEIENAEVETENNI
jgi:DNA gyrase subunit A